MVSFGVRPSGYCNLLICLALVTSPDVFSPLRVQRELARRDAVRDAI
jgi:hypothetical protein